MSIWDHPDAFRFEESGTMEWFCHKTGAPILEKPLFYRIKSRPRSFKNVKVSIIDPRRRFRKTVAYRVTRVEPTTDWWPDEIGKAATQAAEYLDFRNSIKNTEDNAYFGDLKRGEL